MTTLPTDRAALLAWWRARSGVDGAIRVGGAVAVVATIECLAGYFLWTGMTLQVQVPDAIGWTLQVGLAGGSAVGTRAFHRGRAEDRWWGLAASILAIVCLVFDASVFALLAHGQINVRPGTLAVVALCQCLAVGYLTVHTLMAHTLAAAPRELTVPPALEVEPEATEAVESPEQGGDVPDDDVDPRTEEVLLPSPNERGDQEEDCQDEDDDEQEEPDGHPIDYRIVPWHQLTKKQAQAEARRLTHRGHEVTQSGKNLPQLRADVRDARRALGEEPAA